MKTEIWKPVVGWEGRYEISNKGRVRAIFKAKYTPPPPRYFGGSLDKDGYRRFGFVLPDKRIKQMRAHQMVAMAFIGLPEDGQEVNHVDTIKLSNDVENLEWTTHKGNSQHAAMNGLRASGERQWRSSLSEESVIFIRQNSNRISRLKLAEMCGVSASAIRHVIRRRCWKTKWSFPRTGYDPDKEAR